MGSALIFRREVAVRILHRRRYFTTHTCAGILFNLLQCKQHFDLGSYVHVRKGTLLISYCWLLWLPPWSIGNRIISRISQIYKRMKKNLTSKTTDCHRIDSCWLVFGSQLKLSVCIRRLLFIYDREAPHSCFDVVFLDDFYGLVYIPGSTLFASGRYHLLTFDSYIMVV